MTGVCMSMYVKRQCLFNIVIYYLFFMSKQKSYKFLYKYMPMQILHKKASLASMKDTYDSLKLGHS